MKTFLIVSMAGLFALACTSNDKKNTGQNSNENFSNDSIAAVEKQRR